MLILCLLHPVRRSLLQAREQFQVTIKAEYELLSAG